MTEIVKKQIELWIVIIVLIGTAFGGAYILSQKLIGQRVEGPSIRSINITTVIDGEGRIVTLATVPERIIVLTPGYAETLYAIGCGDKIVAVDDGTAQKGYPLEVRNKTTVGKAASPSLEKIIGLNPDLIIAYPYSRTALSSLESKVAIYYVGYEKS
ncbi:MAG: ABC transporter substrate-binding protein, partial [Candidatus Thermoplasmatota archaeon]|nr:ABC transporter substrate-binding protein [Candidatus Thermoplasmatota archaeon]